MQKIVVVAKYLWGMLQGKPRLDLYYARDMCSPKTYRLREHGRKCAAVIAIPANPNCSWQFIVLGGGALNRFRSFPLCEMLPSLSGFPVVYIPSDSGRTADTKELKALLNGIGFTVYELEEPPW